MKFGRRKRLFRLFIRWIPKKRQLHGGILHRIIGDKLFDPRLWNFSIRGVAGGLALGTLIAFTPTFPFQMILAGVLGYVFKVNIPLAIMGCWITNPVTMPIVYPLEYKLGEWVSQALSLPDISEFPTHTREAESVLKQMDLPRSTRFFNQSMPVVINLFIGSSICSVIMAILVYFGTFFTLSKFKSNLTKIEHHMNDKG